MPPSPPANHHWRGRLVRRPLQAAVTTQVGGRLPEQAPTLYSNSRALPHPRVPRSPRKTGYGGERNLKRGSTLHPELPTSRSDSSNDAWQERRTKKKKSRGTPVKEPALRNTDRLQTDVLFLLGSRARFLKEYIDHDHNIL